MVRFGWPVKSSKYSEKDVYPPLSYREEDNVSPVAFPSTTSPDIPTIPTHFLTLPLWRKHQVQQANPPQRISTSDSENYGHSLDCHCRTQETLDSREKALPPTPIASNEDAPGVHLRRMDSPIDVQPLSNRPSGQAPQSVVAPATRPSPSRATAALAHASLAIGLPHSMPRASASSSRSDVNSLAFIPIPRSDQHPFPTTSVRRTKSFHHLSNGNSTDDGGLLPHVKRSRRSRGISFGPLNGPDSEGKGKGKALEDIPSHVTPPRKSLVHRASFWGRRRDDPTKSPIPALPPRDSFDHLSPVLPSLPPMSPLHFDAAVSRSSHSSQTEELLPPSPPGLGPRDECNRPLPPSPSVSSSEMPVRSLRPPACRRQRPSTADPAIERSRALSFFGPSSTTDKSALRTPLVPAPSQHPIAATPQQAARPRSQTNPPLLHRLSANIFSFGSSSSSLSASRVTSAQFDSPEPSPRASTSKPPSVRPHDEESPAQYVDRLLGTVSKAEIASVLASRCDPN